MHSLFKLLCIVALAVLWFCDIVFKNSLYTTTVSAFSYHLCLTDLVSNKISAPYIDCIVDASHRPSENCFHASCGILAVFECSLYTATVSAFSYRFCLTDLVSNKISAPYINCIVDTSHQPSENRLRASCGIHVVFESSLYTAIVSAFSCCLCVTDLVSNKIPALHIDCVLDTLQLPFDICTSCDVHAICFRDVVFSCSPYITTVSWFLLFLCFTDQVF